jgi:hypothetical protein
VIPARFTVNLTAAVDDQDGMDKMWDLIHAALDAIPGVFGEGGSSSLVATGDVIAGSPLDRYLAAASKEQQA